MLRRHAALIALLAFGLCGCDAWVGLQIENTLSEAVRIDLELEHPRNASSMIRLGPGEVTKDEVGFVTGGTNEWRGYIRTYSNDGRLVAENRWTVRRADGKCRLQIRSGVHPDELLPCLRYIPTPTASATPPRS